MKNTSLIIVATILLSACSKTQTETKYVSAMPPKESTRKEETMIQELQMIESLLKRETPNIALAELLSRTLPKEQKEEMKKTIGNLSPTFVKAVLESMLRDANNIKRNFLFHNEQYQNNHDFIAETLLNPKYINQSQYSKEEILRISVFTYLKNSALDEIIETYRNRSLVLAKEMANSIIFDLADSKEFKNQFEINSADEFVQKLLTYKPYIEKIDEYFKSSSLSKTQQYTVTMSALIAGIVYTQVKDHHGIQNFINTTKKIISNANELGKKAKELTVLVHAMESHIAGLKKDARDIAEGIKAVDSDLSLAYREAKESLNKPESLRSKRMISFLNDNVIQGKRETTSNPSVFSQPIRINENIEKTINSAISMSNNLSKILKTTSEMCDLLGVTLSKDTLKVIDSANKVAAVAKIASAAIQGFASGGVAGAFAAIGATGVSGLTSAFGGGDSNAMEFAYINKKLDQILANQKMIMEMQIETMKMIKDLAIMVDEYHQKEMLAMAELRDNSLVSLEMQKVSLNKEIRNCERLINFQLASIWNDDNTRLNPNFGIYNVEMITKKFLGGIKNLGDIQKIANSGGSNSFAGCQDGIAEAFGAEINSENPVLAIYMTSEDDRLYKWQRDTYSPLLAALTEFTTTKDFDSIPLHLPSATFRGLAFKNHYLQNVGRGLKDYSDNYELENLISTKSLERYLSRYLVLYPILELDKSSWGLAIEEIVNGQLEATDRSTNFNTRSFYNLRNALKMVQSAIAQEAILAGEPLLPFLYKYYAQEILEKSACGGNALICAMKENKLLMKNFLAYSLNIRFSNEKDFYHEYAQAYDQKDKKKLASLLFLNLSEERLAFTDDQVMLDQKYYLPVPDEMAMERVIYSENMDRLLKMQVLVTEALEKVVPVKRETRLAEQFKIMMIQN